MQGQNQAMNRSRPRAFTLWSALIWPTRLSQALSDQRRSVCWCWALASQHWLAADAGERYTRRTIPSDNFSGSTFQSPDGLREPSPVTIGLLGLALGTYTGIPPSTYIHHG
ncbi:hypothetical protein CA13_09660 [Planctomycetes bacterium CA13]|uniref:Uncharacterized protein n=1 Tax=Novipirellula herctigrandis TaxID=2527986 RepID=A0A5C5YX21_9BACT|nr:hypothetical protein CA13_09660 [Planctomycetes bacterium CA13]